MTLTAALWWDEKAVWLTVFPKLSYTTQTPVIGSPSLCLSLCFSVCLLNKGDLTLEKVKKTIDKLTIDPILQVGSQN